MNRHPGRSSSGGTRRRAITLAVVSVAVAAFMISHPAQATGAAGSEDAEPSKSYEDFIDAVWIYESDIDPSQQSYYNENWKLPVVPPYPEVSYPGRVIRDLAGDPVYSNSLTVEQFFEVIGIADLYSPDDPNPDWKLIQSNVINYLGFVGFQFQESDLVDLGYYKFDTVTFMQNTYPAHYIDVPNHYWANGVRAFLAEPPLASVPTWARDVVMFSDENFTGKNGIASYKDFTTPDKHILVIKDHFENKYHGIVTGLADRGKTLQEYLGTYVYWDQLDPSVSPPPGGRANKVEITMSGLLAGAHLRGAAGIVSLLVDHKNPSDENGTYILQYVQDYAGYDTPYGNDPIVSESDIRAIIGD
ncbi:hypothetical protein [Candidatus Poriferisodalis sp.]|uniref:hypothetical protein n=1 Tax=Candidatus Poriferisodalis sp. TaxID=3101277 RepID=UPI003B017807